MASQPVQLGNLEPSFDNKNRSATSSTSSPYIVPNDYSDITSLDARLANVSIGKLATAVAAGSTTTMVVLNSQAPYLSVGQAVDIYDSTDTPKASATGKSITVISSSATTGLTTVTFTTAAGGSTAVGDYFKLTTNPYSGAYSSDTLNKMTVNDKLAAVRFHNDSATI